MKVRELQTDFDLQFRAQPRSPGLHVSECIRENAVALGMYKGDDQEELDWTLARYRAQFGEKIVMYPQALYRVAMGLAWEEWWGSQHPDYNFHAFGELSRDGLVGTPDGLEYRPSPVIQMVRNSRGVFVAAREQGIIHEIKVTWKSSRSDRQPPEERIGKEWPWLAQTKAYCYMADQPEAPVRLSNLHVYWVNGNYRGSGPELKSYELEFSEKELQANWKVIKATAARLQAQRAIEA